MAKHIDDHGKTHGKCAQEPRLHWMSNHGSKCPRIQSIPEQADDASSYEKENIDRKYHDRDPIKPTAVIRECVQEDRDHACPHYHGEPSDCELSVRCNLQPLPWRRMS